MRRALAERDVASVYRILQRHGISQRKIAATTGQSQSEISEILGGRKVVAYDVLVRIAAGLGVERGKLGLAYDANTAAFIATSPPVPKPRPVARGGEPSWWVHETVDGDS